MSKGFREFIDGQWVTVFCPYNECDGSGQTTVLDESGHRLAGNCTCFYRKRIDEQWKRTVGTHDQWVRLTKLVPSEKSALPIDAQQKCIAAMQKDPSGSYAMFGPSGASKTTFTVALYRKCLFDNYTNARNIIRIKTKTLLETIQAYRYDDDFRSDHRPPFTTAERIRSQASMGNKTHLFLEELEKVKYTENRATEIFDIIDAVYEEGGQLVVTGNLTFDDLNDTNKFVEGFPRRIDEICGKHKWDFWKYVK